MLRIKRKQYDSSGSVSALAWRKFKKNHLAYFSFVFIIFTVLIAVLGYLTTPDSTPYANQQFLELAARKPGFKAKMLLIRKSQIPVSHSPFSILHSPFLKMMYGAKSDYTYIPISSYEFKDDNITVELYNEESDPSLKEYKQFSMSEVIYGNSDHSILRTQNSELRTKCQNQIITKRFLLGTDRFGRDMLSQLIIGTRVSLSVGFISVIISLLLGIVLGAVAGYFRGNVDNFIVWLINVVWSIPSLLLVIAITFALGKGFWQVFIAVGLTMWVEVARVVRGQFISIREKEFVEAAKALGFRNSRIIFKHILPNVMGSVIVISAANFASAILTEAGLSFLGLGVQPPVPSWGTMIKEHYPYIVLGNAWLPLIPGIAIMLMVLAFMLVGNGLRDALDVKLVQNSR